METDNVKMRPCCSLMKHGTIFAYLFLVQSFDYEQGRNAMARISEAAIHTTKTAGLTLFCVVTLFVAAAVAQDGTNLADSDTALNAQLLGREGMRYAVQVLLIPYVSELQQFAEGESGDVVGRGATSQRMYEALDLVIEADELAVEAQELIAEGDKKGGEQLRKKSAQKYQEAIPKLEEIFQDDPTLFAVWATLGWTYWLSGEPHKTVDLWLKLSRIAPNDPKPYAFLGTAYFASKKLLSAEDCFKKSLALDPTQVDVRIKLGVLYRWLGRAQESVDVLRTLLAEDPDRLDVQNELAMSLYLNRDYEDALRLLPIARKTEPDPDRAVQYALAEIRALLFSGDPDMAIQLLDTLLEADGNSVELLTLQADAHCYKNRHENAIPSLTRIIDVADDAEVRRVATRRLVEISTKLWEREPGEHTLERPIQWVRDVLEEEPDLVEWNLLLGEIQLMDGQYLAAGDVFEHVLKVFNPRNLRAIIGLLEVYQATGRATAADTYFDRMREFNPHDPYILDRLARLELSRNCPQKAYKALSELERRGAAGAVAILMYRGLSRTDWAGSISMRQFHEHLAHLKSKGYTFLSMAQLPDYLVSRPEPAEGDLSDYVPDRAVVVCFDYPRIETMTLATEVAANLNVPLSTFVPVASLESSLTSERDWAALREFQASGMWSFGSFLMDSHNPIPVDGEGHTGAALANLGFNNDTGAFENGVEFFERISREFRESKEIAHKRLGDNADVSFLLYPQGDIGQAGRSNYDRASDVNLEEARTHYRCGLINMIHGYAVKGDNPMLYQHYSPEVFDTGDDILNRLHEHHPVFLARRLRAEVAALDGRIYRACEMLDILERDEYPDPLLTKVSRFVRQHLAQNFEATANVEHSKDSPFSLSLKQPYLGLRGHFYEDSDDRENIHFEAFAGVDPFPQLVVEAYTGYGQLKEGGTTNNLVVDDESGTGEDYSVDETTIGLKASYRLVSRKGWFNPISLGVDLGRRDYSGDATHSINTLDAQVTIRPWLPVTLLGRFERDSIETAQAVVEQTEYDLLALDATYRVQDWWELIGTFRDYDISDGNVRRHMRLSSMWEIHEPTGIWAGLRYDRVHADLFEDAYWTPDNLRQYALVCQIKQRYFDWYYDLWVLFGRAKEDVSDEEQERYDSQVEQAEEQGWIDDIDDPPSTDWEWVFTASGLVQYELSKHARAFIQATYIEMTDRDEFHLKAGLKVSF